MNTQQMVDWAFEQRGLSVEEKLALVVLATSADPSGGGKVTIGDLSRAAECSLPAALGLAVQLQSAGRIIIKYLPGLDSASAADDEIAFGLCMEGSGSS